MPREPDNKRAARRRLISVRQAGWALSLATVAAAAVGLVVVRRLGGSDAAPPIEVESTGPTPMIDYGPQFQVLRPDDPPVGLFDALDAPRWEQPAWPAPLASEPTERPYTAREPSDQRYR